MEGEREADRLRDLLDELVRPGSQPTVEIVVRRCVIPTSGSRRAAARTASTFMKGSPIPMKTRWSTGSVPAEVEHLVEDLPRGEVPSEGHRPVAQNVHVSGQPGLRRDADRAAPVPVAHQHGLDRVPVGGLEEGLDGAVARTLLVLGRQRRERDLGGERLPERAREVGHRVVAGGAARCPVPGLSCAVARLAELRDALLQKVEVHVRYSAS